jgi:drug/metabolite transporter (DMT)-like permease
MGTSDPVPAPALLRGRLFIVLAAVLWSLSGAFTRVLGDDTPLRLGPEPVGGLTIAFYRVFFAGLVLVPTLRRCDLGEVASARGWAALLLGLAGVAVIVAGGWTGGDLPVIGLGLASGLFFAGVVLFLRVLRGASAGWLTVLNHLGAAAAVAPLLLISGKGWPSLTWSQLGVLALFGAVQMGIPYLLMARGLRVVSTQEAGVITLLEPLLNPLWAYLVAPQKESPTAFTLAGGVLILGALAWRYWPARKVG